MNMFSIVVFLGIILPVCTACASSKIGQAAPLRIGSEKQLFLGPWSPDGRDEYLIESMTGVKMTANEARITGEKLMVIDKPWEISPDKPHIDVRQCVIRDGDMFRMYYSVLPKNPKIWEEPYCRILCYAESKDGIHWEKPSLGLWEFNGSRDNNIIIPNDDLKYIFSECEGASVFIDPVAKIPQEKYKMFLKMTPVQSNPPFDGPMLKKGQYAFCSADGIRWKLMSEKHVNPGSTDTQFSVFWDDAYKQYAAYTRVKRIQEPTHYKVVDLVKYHKEKYGLDINYRGRLVGRSTSADFLLWSKERSVFAPDNLDGEGIFKDIIVDFDTKETDAAEPMPLMDIYGPNVTKYSEAKNAYIAMPNMFYHWKQTQMNHCGKIVEDTFPGTVDVQLITSRDGIHWDRTPDRAPFLRLGPSGSWYSKMLWPDGKIHRVGDELWMFFCGVNVGHNQEGLHCPADGARGRAVLRLDGFLSADTDYHGGEMATHPMMVSGSKLQLNVDAGAGGSVRVEIQDASGHPLPGYAAADADEINGNHIRISPTWKGSSAIDLPADQPVKLRFLMRSAKLYSFQFLSAR